MTPNKKGFNPVSLMSLIAKALPIKNSVMINNVLEIDVIALVNEPGKLK